MNPDRLPKWCLGNLPPPFLSWLQYIFLLSMDLKPRLMEWAGEEDEQ